MATRPIIAILSNWYLPGFKGGGPIRSIANMVEFLGDEFDIKVITSNHDHGEKTPYPHIKPDEWTKQGKASIYYLSPSKRTLSNLARLLRSTPHDVLYLNSFFSPNFTWKPLMARRLGLIPKKPLLVAPRGEFSSEALGLKSAKKSIYNKCAKLFGVYKDAIWHATSDLEKKNVKQIIGQDANVFVASNLPSPHLTSADPDLPEKKIKGVLKILFLARITRMKNLLFALQVLSRLKTSRIEFNIYGAVDDISYWKECEYLIQNLPSSIKVQHHGETGHDSIPEVIRSHHVLFLPTLGENFGHSIIECLCGGRPVVISDRTPWRNLAEKKIGFDIPLDKPEKFQEALDHFIGLDQAQFLTYCQSAQQWGSGFLKDNSLVAENKRMFHQVLASK